MAQIRQLQFELESAQKELEEKSQANQELEDKIYGLEKTLKGSNEKKLKDLNRQLEFQVDELMEQLEAADAARK